jgi:hypothetical protein
MIKNNLVSTRLVCFIFRQNVMFVPSTCTHAGTCAVRADEAVPVIKTPQAATTPAVGLQVTTSISTSTTMLSSQLERLQPTLTDFGK